jgi:hypothetical protein
MSIGWKPKNLDFDNTFVWKCGCLLSMYFTPIFFCTIGICKHVNATYVGDIGLDGINVKINFNYNGEMFYKLKQLGILVFSSIQTCGSYFIQYFNK